MLKNKLLLILLTVLSLTGFVLFQSCGKTDKDTSKNDKKTETKSADETKLVADGKYACTMHPTMQSNEPARCPICRMNMVLKDDFNRQINEKRNSIVKRYEKNKDIISEVITLSVLKSNECEDYVNNLLKNDAGVYETNINIIAHDIAVYFDKTKTDKAKIEKEISDSGFDANNVKANPDAKNKLPNDCK